MSDNLTMAVDKFGEKIVSAIPQHMRGDDPLALVKGQLGVALQGTPKLAECDPLTVIYSMRRAVRLGLDFSGASGQAYLVPFYNSRREVSEATLIIGYKGFITLASRATKARAFRAVVVYEGEPFEYVDGLAPILRHEPTFGHERASEAVVCAYAIAEWADGYRAWKVAPGYYLQQIESDALKKAGNRPTPWKGATRPEMLAKTAVRYLCKGLDLSPDIAEAMTYDEKATGHMITINEDPEYRELAAPVGQQRQASIEADLVKRGV